MTGLSLKQASQVYGLPETHRNPLSITGKGIQTLVLASFGASAHHGCKGHEKVSNFMESSDALSICATSTFGEKTMIIQPKFQIGDRVRKTKGSSWQGIIVGTYSTILTPIGYCVESEREPGSVQIYPQSALEKVL